MRHRGGPDVSFETLKYKFDLQTKNFYPHDEYREGQVRILLHVCMYTHLVQH